MEEQLTCSQLLGVLETVLASETERSAIISRYKDEPYSKTYPHYISLLNKHRRANAESHALRVAAVGSWVATILKPDFCAADFREYITMIKKIENQNELTDAEIVAVLKCANQCLNQSSSVNIATASKLLHLDLPEMFPILDVNVGKVILNRGPYLGQRKYITYYRHLQSTVREKPEKLAQFKKQLEKAMGYENEISEIRAADIALFDKGKQGEKA